MASSVGVRVSYRCFVLALAVLPLSCIAAPLWPTTEGMTWNYDLIEEKPSSELDLAEPNTKQKSDVTYRMAGTQTLDGHEFSKMEVRHGATIENTDLITIDNGKVVCAARMIGKGELTKFDPPQTLVAAPLQIGTIWNFDGKMGGTKVSQRCVTVAEEDVNVPAGKFHAWRIHCEQTQPRAAKIERWFVPGTGFVKIVTRIDASSGAMLQKSSLELRSAPKVEATASTPSPAITSAATPGPAKVSLGLSDQPTGDFKTTFKSDTSDIYVRWQGHDLHPGAKLRAEWIAENVQDVDPNDEIDEALTESQTPNSHGVFTLGQPEGGWTPGDYRVDLYLDDNLVATAKAKIVK